MSQAKSNCFYCGCEMRRWLNHPQSFSVDHRTPKCRGGGNNRENKRYVCRACNGDKGHLTEGEYLAVLEYRKKNPNLFSSAPQAKKDTVVPDLIKRWKVQSG